MIGHIIAILRKHGSTSRVLAAVLDAPIIVKEKTRWTGRGFHYPLNILHVSSGWQSESCQPQYNLISSYPISKELDSLEEATRDIHTMMQRLHNPDYAKENTVLTRNKFNVLKNIYKKLESQLDPRFAGNYSKLWSKAASCAVYLAMMMVYLDSNAIATKQQVEKMLGLAGSQSVKIDSAKYTQGLLELSEELASLADNYKVLEDYGMPGRIAVILRQIRYRLETGSGTRQSIEKIKSDLKKVAASEKALKAVKGQVREEEVLSGVEEGWEMVRVKGKGKGKKTGGGEEEIGIKLVRKLNL